AVNVGYRSCSRLRSILSRSRLFRPTEHRRLFSSTRDILGLVKFALLIFAAVAVHWAEPRGRVDWYGALENLRGEPPVIRATDTKRAFLSVQLELTIDASGEVVGVDPLYVDSPQLVNRAAGLAKTLRFRPFLRKGAPVQTLIDMYVPVLPPERFPVRH